jgi:hypothetical protein
LAQWCIRGVRDGVGHAYEDQFVCFHLPRDGVGSIWTGRARRNSTGRNAVWRVSLALDTISTWSVTANSVLTSLSESAGVSGTSINNIKGNGFTVTYDQSLSANSYLGGKTYTLVNGGTLAPGTSITSTDAPVIAAAGVLNAASGVAGVTPGAWISIYGSNLSTSAVSAITADVVNN